MSVHETDLAIGPCMSRAVSADRIVAITHGPQSADTARRGICDGTPPQCAEHVVEFDAVAADHHHVGELQLQGE